MRFIPTIHSIYSWYCPIKYIVKSFLIKSYSKSLVSLLSCSTEPSVSKATMVAMALMMVTAGSGIWTTFSVSQFLGFLMPGAPSCLLWTCARLSLQWTDWACCVHLPSASRPLPLLLPLTSQASHVPSTSRLTGQVAVWLLIRLAATLLLPSGPVTPPRGRAIGPRRSFTVIQLGGGQVQLTTHKHCVWNKVLVRAREGLS